MSVAADTDSLCNIPDSDRAYLYGDGLFETLLLTRGSVLFLQLHLDRLMGGARRLRIAVSRAQVLEAIQRRVASAKRSHAILRVTVSRAGGQRGYRPSADAGSRIHVSVTELQDDPLDVQPPAVVASSAVSMATQPLLAGIKHCNRLEQVLAAMEAADRGVDDVILNRDNGELQCSSNANIFSIRGRLLVTPPCSMAGVAGTRRRLLLEGLAQRAGLDAREQPLLPQELETADAVFLSNSVMGIREVGCLDGRVLEPSALVHTLQQLYRKEALSCCAA